MKFTCTKCGKIHDLTDISFVADHPLQWEMLADAEREESQLGEEQCIINSEDGTHHFVRACLEIPIRGTNHRFTWTVWVSLSEDSFQEMSESWEDSDRVRLGPYFGWLCTRIPEYPDTMFLKTMVHQQEVGLRPTVALEPTDHLLSVHQRRGIDPDDMEEIITKLMH
jgi:hypothetical protein